MSLYALITAAHNEEAFIELTIKAVLEQKVRPVRWIIVDDGSTDRTAEIVRRYSTEHTFMTLMSVRRPPGRNFGSKAKAFNLAVPLLAQEEYSYVGNLDADITVNSDYFESLLSRFEGDSKLGIAGGMVWSRTGSRFCSQNVAEDSVAGAVQLYRRECFDIVGGLSPLPSGGEDSFAEIKARMNNWRVRTFPEYKVFEHRKTGSASHGPILARIKEGRRFYTLGYGFVYYLARCIRRLMETPQVLGSIAALCGYIGSWLRNTPILLPRETVNFLRAEQHAKLKQLAREMMATVTLRRGAK